MAAADPVLPSEEVVLLELGKVRHLPPLLLCPGALWRAPPGGGDPPHLRLPVHPPLHPLLLQHGCAGYLPPTRAPQAHPTAHRALCHLPVDFLDVLRHRPLLPCLRLQHDLPAAPGHAALEPVWHVCPGAREPPLCGEPSQTPALGVREGGTWGAWTLRA
uniref:Transmembrane protein 79 n=1 Tax=Corvus moneduloides TaxID=1196302 RepID=A0A8U7NYN9_CORMO